MDYHVYILESEATGNWYYGFTEDIDQRLSDHQTNRSKYTRKRGPWRLIFKRKFASKSDALHFEKYLKEIRNKVFIRRAYGEYFIGF